MARVSAEIDELTYDGRVLNDAAPRSVVVVTANYRLARLGFLAHAGLTAEEGTSGNYALLTHSQEVALVWGWAEVEESGATAADRAVGARIVDYWTRFAYTGDPNGDDAPEWPSFETDTEPEIVLADPISTTKGRKSDRCDFWATVQ